MLPATVPSICARKLHLQRMRHCLYAEDDRNYPLILTKDWFEANNAGRLRKHLRLMILSMFIEQAADKDCGPVQEAIVEKNELEEQAKGFMGM